MTAGKALELADQMRPNNDFSGRDEADVAAPVRRAAAADGGEPLGLR